ncbi:inward rectifier potassium channel 16 [Erpetoichthys calabaricus]|uniref:inward rectifier potassium channel 16 n=1 Tax=Erpetoichthys calabaricus TaxID=27687 RepID=UPI0010A0775F|nr:inward rectifier potassium channel 16 [Erpetoichthys calabaricus]XP_051774925.1 inward rectifier potassium channel 16 [Erpetoichthys calabaricus]
MSYTSTQYVTLQLSDGSRKLSFSKAVGQKSVGQNRRQKRSRYVQEDGSCNVLFHHLPGEWGSYISDIFTTLVEIRWRIMLLIYSLSYVLSWLFFGVLFWLIAIIHGDMDDPNNDPCMANVRSFAGAFLFSLESQATIGYGYRCVTEECALAIILLTAQSVLSCIIDTFIIGGAVAKMASGRRRAQTIGFSDCAVICLRDGKLCLVWRIGDFRQNHMVEGTARAQLLRFQDHPRGKVSMTYHDLKLSDNEVILVTPVLIVHEIGPGSPFYGMSRRDLLQEDFELVVTFTYTGDSTGILHQTRTAFAPEDILWGHQFLNMLKVKERYYKVDYAEFNNTKEVYAPDYSAEEHNQKEQAWFIQPCIISHDTETKTSYPELKPSITSKNHENQLHKSNEVLLDLQEPEITKSYPEQCGETKLCVSDLPGPESSTGLSSCNGPESESSTSDQPGPKNRRNLLDLEEPILVTPHSGPEIPGTGINHGVGPNVIPSDNVTPKGGTNHPDIQDLHPGVKCSALRQSESGTKHSPDINNLFVHQPWDKPPEAISREGMMKENPTEEEPLYAKASLPTGNISRETQL